MGRMEAFLPTRSLFVILEEVVGQHGGRLVFQRFESATRPAGFWVFDPLAEAADAYLEGGYRVIYISLGPTPLGPQDWAFLERAEAHLIELEGGRQQDRDLELVVARTLAKRSRAEKLFRGLRDAMRLRCDEGVQLNGQPYPNILHARELAGKDVNLWLDLDTRTISASTATRARNDTSHVGCQPKPKI